MTIPQEKPIISCLQMNQVQPLQSPARQTPQASVNPFARALAESERATNYAHSDQSGQADTVPGSDQDHFAPAEDSTAAQLRSQEKQIRLEQLRKRLHEQVNPVDTTAVFDARERETQNQVEQLRYELAQMSKEVISFEKEVEVTLMTQIVNPGQEGSYYFGFFTKLRTFIMFLRQKIKSARTWCNTSKGKAQKMGKQPGMVISGLDHEKTSTIQNMMHHERSNAYAGS